MSIVKRAVVITDLTRMKPPRVCVGGYFLDEKTCVRPVIPHEGITEEFLFSNGALVIKPFAVVEFDFIRHIPDPPHTEDWEIDPDYHRLIREQLLKDEQKEFLKRLVEKDQSISMIFGSNLHRDNGTPYVLYGEGERSLGTIRPKDVQYVKYAPNSSGKWDYRITFIGHDEGNDAFNLPITDLAYRNYCDHERSVKRVDPKAITLHLKTRFNHMETYFRVGLARRFPNRFPNHCYLQITGIYTFPDYLQGRNFTDFPVST